MTQASRDDSTLQKSPGAGDPLLPAWNAQLIESGLEVAPATEQDKQYINPVSEGDKEAFNRATGKEAVTSQGYQLTSSPLEPEKASPKHRKLCGLKRRWLWTLLVVALLLIALAIGLAVGLSSRASPKASDSTQTEPSASPTQDEPPSDAMEIGGSINPSYFSGSGVWNGSGSALALQNFHEDFDDAIADQVYDKVVYFQHHTGEIRWMRQTANKTQAWQPAPPNSEVASDAKNSTPLSTVNMLWSTSEWHVFCKSIYCVVLGGIDFSLILLIIQPDIDSEHQVRHRKGNNKSMSWNEGSTRQAKLKAWDGDLIGLTACWGTSNDFPIRLFYASSNATFEEYLWRRPDDTWHWQRSWDGFNGAAAIRCYGGSPSNTDRGANRYLVLMNSNHQIEVWYQNKDDGSLGWAKCKHSRD